MKVLMASHGGCEWKGHLGLNSSMIKRKQLKQVYMESGWNKGQTERGAGRPYEPFVGFKLAEEYKGRWNEIGEFLGNLKSPEGKTPKEMQQF